MLIKVLHQELCFDAKLLSTFNLLCGLKKLLAVFPNNAFELIPAVFIVLETCVFSVSSKR